MYYNTKLDLLETEREYLLEMCPKDKRDTYEDAKVCAPTLPLTNNIYYNL